MQRHPSGPPYRSSFTPSDNQKYTLNQLLQQSVTSSIRSPIIRGTNVSDATLARQSGMNMPSQLVSSKDQHGMRLMLQQQQSQLRAVMQTSNNILRNAAPSGRSSQLPSATQPRQYVLVPAPANAITSLQTKPKTVPQPLKPSSAPSAKPLSGQIQLGQTYQFDVDRSSKISRPSGIILKQSPHLQANPGQIPPRSNDKGKFIPLSELFRPQTNSQQLAPKLTNFLVPQTRPLSGGHPSVNSPSNLAWKNVRFAAPHPQNLATSSGVMSTQSHNIEVKKEPGLRKESFEHNSRQNSSFRLEDPETEPFDWDEYLKVTNSKAAPHSSFKHVEISLHNGFNPGMKLEVANKSDPSTYWVATLISTCGSLLLLRYDGYGDDRKTDFWADVCTADLHPIGWCAQNGKILQPPESIRNMHENWAEFLVGNLIGARTAPERLLTGPFKGKTVVEMIESGMLLEVQDSQHPQHVWMVDVLKNVGGRLLLRYKGLSDADSKHDFWLFYLDVRLHQVGWGKDHHLTMKPPDAIRNKYTSKEQWAYVLTLSLKGVTEQHLVPACVFQDQVKLKPHGMQQSFKLAVLDPIDPTKIRPATVIKVVDEFFFLAELDNLRDKTTSCAFLCHSGSSGVFSVAWCKKYDIPIVSPQGYNVSKFDWDQYLKLTCAQAAPDSCFAYSSETHEFEAGMELEACSPYNLYEICVASIVKVYGNVLHLRLAAPVPSGPKMSQNKKFVDCFVHSSSQDIFPVGWCHSNNYPLSFPAMWRQKPLVQNNFSANYPSKKIAVVQPEVQTKLKVPPPVSDQSLRSVINPSANSKLWCPVICFNCTCKSGIFLNDHDLSKVPRFVGPGNTVLVLKEVLTLLVGAAERPHKLLKDLEDFTLGRWEQPCIVKTKFDGKKYQATLHIVNTASEVPAFFKSLSQFLKCCPNLLTLTEPMTNCPLNCMREKPLGRPPSGRGRGRKFMFKGIRTDAVAASRSSAESGLKTYMNRTRAYRILRRFPSNLRGYKNHRAIRSIKKFLPPSSNYMKRSVNVLPSHTKHKILLQNLRRRQERVKLHRLHLQSNPLQWTVEEVVEFIQSTDCTRWAKFFSHHLIDGQAFLLLTLPVIQECLEMKLGPALKIARHVERVKMAFYEKFAGL